MTADVLLADVVQERDLNEVEARYLVDGMRRDVSDLGERIATAYIGRAWIALGYSSWDTLCDAEFDGARLRIPREQRVEQVQSLRSAGLSTRAIGSALGVGEATVRRDLSSTAPDDAVEQPSTVQSLDGRTRPASQPPRPLPSPASGPAVPAGNGSGAGEPAVPVGLTKQTTKTETYFDTDTGEAIDPGSVPIENHPDYQPEPRWQPAPASPEAQAARDRRVSNEAFSANLAKHAWFFARLARTDLAAAELHAGHYLPEPAAAYGGVDPDVLRDAARYLLALADAWKKAA